MTDHDSRAVNAAIEVQRSRKISRDSHIDLVRKRELCCGDVVTAVEIVGSACQILTRGEHVEDGCHYAKHGGALIRIPHSAGKGRRYSYKYGLVGDV